VRLVWSRERAAGDIAAAFDVSWPAVSQNLRVLKESGLVLERRDGTRRLYRADRRALRPLEAYLRNMWTRDIDRLRLLAEAEERGRSSS
jgi:DNA-binding transcriptional ArsR family regulator